MHTYVNNLTSECKYNKESRMVFLIEFDKVRILKYVKLTKLITQFRSEEEAKQRGQQILELLLKQNAEKRWQESGIGGDGRRCDAVDTSQIECEKREPLDGPLMDGCTFH